MIREPLVSFKEPQIKECFDAVGYEVNDTTIFYKQERFRKCFAYIEMSELTWDYLCDSVKKSPSVVTYATRFLMELFDRDMLISDKDTHNILKRVLSLQKENIGKKTSSYNIFLKDKIKDALFFKNPRPRDNDNIVYAFMPCSNRYFHTLVFFFLSQKERNGQWGRLDVLYFFAESLGEELNSIHSYTDFNEKLFWKQIAYYKTAFEDEEQVNQGIGTVLQFYRWLVLTFGEYDFFADAFSLSRGLLFNSKFFSYLKEGYYVTTYDSNNPPLGQTNICFILRNMGNLTSQLTNDGYVTLSLQPVEATFYRDLIIRYFLSSNNAGVVVWQGQIGNIKKGLHFLELLKSGADYPNRNLAFLETKEAILLRKAMHDEEIQLASLNNRIGALRRFFDWCKDNKLIEFENMFFDSLKQYEEPPKTGGHSIPEQDLIKLHNVIVEHAKDDYDWQLALYIFHILLDTNFRVGQVRTLGVDCIGPSLKSGQYELRDNTKVDHDVRHKKYIITEATRRLILEAINFTEEIRNNCTDPNLKDYIFLRSSYLNHPAVIGQNKFRDIIVSACEEAGVPHYTASNIRDTYMTNAIEYILRHGKSDIEMKAFSKHKSIDTTKNHYIQMSLEKMLESTYGIDLGEAQNIDADKKVVDAIPSELASSKYDVQEGCGKCSAESCFAKGPAPCMLCKHFITTVDYEKYFVAEIEKLDRAIEKTTCRHDIEDLVVIKTLYVQFLEAIYMKKETMKSDN